MGGSSSKEVVVYIESDESKRMKLLGKLENQLEDLKKEVISIQQTFNEGVRSTVSSEKNALIMRYSQLQDTKTIVRNIREIFVDFPAVDFLVDTATKLVAAMNETEEMKEILRWQERKVVKRIGDKVYGMEVHYKVKVLEESKGLPGFKSKETVVLIAYKCLAHVMDYNPADYPDDEELKALRF